MMRRVEGRGTNRYEDIFYLLFGCCLSRQPTAVMRAAPFPLPSSDSRKVTSHCGASSFTVWCMILEKLERLTITTLAKVLYHEKE